MNPYELITFPSQAALALSVAARWLEELSKPRQNQRTRRVALSGGRSAREFLAAVTTLAAQHPIDWNGVDFFWSDERCVPPDHVESNFKLANDTFLSPLGVSPERVHRVRGELEPAQAAEEAEAELCEIATRNSNGQPVLDLVFLGMGEDGHVASLFPGLSEDLESRKAAYVPVIGPKPPPQRISMNYPCIAAAHQVWVLTSGEAKTKALRESISAGGSTPLARVLRMRPRTLIFTDIHL